MKQIPVILFGVGGVGQALLRQIVDGRAHLATRVQYRFQVVALADSRSWLWARDGLSDAELLAAIDAKQRGQLLSREERPSDQDMIGLAVAAGLEAVVVVDATAVAGIEPVIDRALAAGYRVALANKKPFAGPWATAQNYFNHPHIRHESTVGGGQPVIATLRYLLDTNDPIERIEGQLSGTLGFICGRLDEGIPFSQAVAEAKSQGYTEPDPREDLGGKDVMRKVMILGRMAGWPLEEGDIAVESLYPAQLAHLGVPAFMAATAELDAAMRQRVATAAAAGHVLRYVAELSRAGGSVGLKAVPAGSPLAHLKYISFCTARYHDEPLLIGGKGAGVEMTAAGILGDMIQLVREHP